MADMNTIIDLLTVIQNLSERTLAFLMLQEDRLFRNIPIRQIKDILDDSLMIGVKLAQQIRLTFPLDSPVNLAAKWRVEIKEEKKHEIPTMYFCSEYLAKPPTVIVYQEAIVMIKKTLLVSDVSFINGDDLFEVYVAHELFHHLEVGSKEIAQSYAKAALIKVGKLAITAKLNSCSEIAAMAFAKTLLGLSYYPKLLDLIILFNHSPILLAGLIEKAAIFSSEMEEKNDW